MREQRILFFILVVVLWAVPAIAAETVDRLDIASGAVLISATTEYNQKWAGMMLLDGSDDMGWCSTKGCAYPNTFIIELPGSFSLETFYIDNTNAQEQAHPGISSRHFKLSVSNTSASEGYQLVCEGEALKGERKGFSIARPVVAQWLKLDVLSNWGDQQYTELMELEAYGEPVGAAVSQQSLNGVYDTNFNLLWLRQSGSRIEGCYDWDNGKLTGTMDGRVIRFQWTEDGPQTGSAVMVLTADGACLNGLWYEDGHYQGLWHGTRITDGRKPRCRQEDQDAVTSNDPVGRSLDNVGRAILYGIYFDYDKSTIRPDSHEALSSLLTAVKARPGAKLVIEGHTDAQGSDRYNQILSENRAQSVVSWLVDHGIAQQRLSAKGLGESQPVADNARPDGRALNRRVEIVLDK